MGLTEHGETEHQNKGLNEVKMLHRVGRTAKLADNSMLVCPYESFYITHINLIHCNTDS